MFTNQQPDFGNDIRIVVTNGFERIINALQELIELEEDMQVIGRSTNHPDTIENIEQLNPDALVVGLMRNERESLDLAGQVSQTFPNTGIVFVSIYNDGFYREEASRMGVHRYVALTDVGTTLAPAIRSAAAESA